MKVRTQVKSAGLANNSNARLISNKKGGLSVKTGVKAGGRDFNRNEKLTSDKKGGLSVKTGIKAGGRGFNRNEKLNSEDKSKTLKTKLKLSKDTLKELNAADLNKVAGGRPPGSQVTCLVGDTCYTHNHNEKLIG